MAREASQPVNRANLAKRIMTTTEIVALLRAQAALRAQENDEAGVLADHANAIEREMGEI
jgi:hypothetical protein